MDGKTALLSYKLKEEILMKLSQVNQSDENKVCKFKEAV